MNARGMLQGSVGMVVVALALGFCANGAQAGEVETFRYRGMDYMSTGSHVERHLTWSATLPFDRTYAELTAAQQAHVREQYSELAPGEEPPYPLGGMRAIFRLVDRNVDQLAGRQEKGPLVAVAKVDDQGVVTQVSVFRTPSPRVTAAITSALVNTPFQPARRNGAPVAMDYLVSVELL